MSDEDLSGFEWNGRFYRWSVTDLGKDLMLIDRIAQMPPTAFMDMIGDVDEAERTPVILALVATSLRLGHPEWSVDRIYRTVMGISLGGDLTFVSAGEGDADPPPEAASQPPSEAGKSPSNGSSQPSTPVERSSSPTSSTIPV